MSIGVLQVGSVPQTVIAKSSYSFVFGDCDSGFRERVLRATTALLFVHKTMSGWREVDGAWLYTAYPRDSNFCSRQIVQLISVVTSLMTHGSKLQF